MVGSAPKGLGVVIASRRLRVERKGRNAVVVRLGMPRRRSATEWHCPFHIAGLGMPRIQRGVGADAIQALMLALGAIHKALEKSGKPVTWEEYGDQGVSGFSPIMPHFMGRQFFRKVERMIERQLWQWTQAKKRKRKQAGKNRPRTR